MKRVIIAFALIALATPVFAQQQTTRTEVIIKHDDEHADLFTLRVGLWFPKDKEKNFTFENNPYTSKDGSIDQSQAFGLDFHYRNRSGKLPLYFDFSASAWYSTYSFKLSEGISNPAQLQDASSWAVIVPFTLGASFTVLPENPIQPYVMAGVGAYCGVSGTTINYLNISSRSQYSDSRTVVHFGWYFGAGLDLFVMPGFGINVAGKYQAIEFEKPLYTQQKDFSGLQVMAGITAAL